MSEHKETFPTYYNEGMNAPSETFPLQYVHPREPEKVSQLTWDALKFSVQGDVALGSHFATLCQEVDFYEAFFFIINFQKEKANTVTLLIILIVKSLQIQLRTWHKSATMTPNLPEKTCNQPKVQQLLGD